MIHLSSVPPHRKDFANFRRMNIQGISFFLVSGLDAKRAGDSEVVFVKKESQQLKDSLRFYSKPRNITPDKKCLVKFKDKDMRISLSFNRATDNLIFSYLDSVTKQKVNCITVPKASSFLGEESYLTVHGLAGKKTTCQFYVFSVKLFSPEEEKELKEETLIPKEDDDSGLPSWSSFGEIQTNVSSLVIKSNSQLQEQLETMMDVLSINSKEMFGFIKMMNEYMLSKKNMKNIAFDLGKMSEEMKELEDFSKTLTCLLYTSPSPRDS
eukprot:TRINITY_DN9443_c0_g1_i2.p1 TRINITY_DN9443_c0_g1~~TRINITY_DN9443_c0_g1_i2.p1  ORF type:complete len:267 (-),score=53.55 TRINITY_DN9443_c0_g1_i2:69-869(-)